MRKYWNIMGNEIMIYGPISESSWLGDEITPKQLAEELKGIVGDITVRINSMGGDVFAAQTMYNLLKSHKGNVTVIIDGICASAASLIACAGSKVTMASNGLYMIHNPLTYLCELAEASTLEKVVEVLNKIKFTMIDVYKNRCKLAAEEIALLMNEETYMTAAEAKELGFVDEIGGQVEVENRNGRLFVNRIEADKVKDYYEGVKEVNTAKAEVSEAIRIERERVSALMKMKTGNIYTDSLIDLAIENGDGATKVSSYIAKMKTLNSRNEFMNHYYSNKTSGAEKVGVNYDSDTDVEEVANYANRMRGLR